MKKGNEAETRLRLQGVAAAVTELADDLMELELAWQVLDGMGVTFDHLWLPEPTITDQAVSRDRDMARQEREVEGQEQEEGEDGSGP
jgi:hypothetical protein